MNQDPELSTKDKAWKGWISTGVIYELCKTLGLPIVGVFSKDLLPVERRMGSYYINLQDSDAGNGTHWVFVRIFKGNKAIYFDPFGLNMPEDVRGFLSKYEPIAWNNRTIQNLKSTLCGLFCIACDYYFQYDCKKKDIYECFDDFLNMWSINPKTNDTILKEYLTD